MTNYYNVMMNVRNNLPLAGAMNVEKDIRQDYGSVTEAQIKRARMNKLKIVGLLIIFNLFSIILTLHVNVLFIIGFSISTIIQILLLALVDIKYYEEEVGF